MVQLEGSRLAWLPKQQSTLTRRPSSGSPSTELTNIWLCWSTSGPVAHLQGVGWGVGGLQRSSTSQQISHFLQGRVASLMATMCFLPPKDTLGTQLTAMCTPPLSPCNFPGITGGARFHTGVKRRRRDFASTQVQETFNQSFNQEMVHHFPQMSLCDWAQLGDPETYLRKLFLCLSASDGGSVGTPASSLFKYHSTFCG